MIVNENLLTSINSPVRRIQGEVELYEGSTLVDTYKYTDYLKSFTVDRVGEGNFFGYGFCQKANVKILDLNREKTITTDNSFVLKLGANGAFATSFPTFHVSQARRDEITNELSVTMYDKLYPAGNHVVNEIGLDTAYPDGYTLYQLAEVIAEFLGIPGVKLVGVKDTLFATYYTHEQVSIEGDKDNLRQMLTWIAQATQTIYYLDATDTLVFKRLDRDGDAVLTIDKSKYMDLDSGENRRLKQITKATELGDNVHIAIAQTGTNVIVKDNPFYELRSDIEELLAPAADSVLGMCINQFECEWRGNYLLEIGDKIGIVTKDNDTVFSYLLDDVIEYEGTLVEKTQWKYDADDGNEEHSNPSTIGEAIYDTFAKVDKVKKQIDLVVKDVDDNTSQIAQLTQTVDGFKATVETVEKEISANSQDIQVLTEKVETAISSEAVDLKISQALENGVTKVETETGFKFDATGLHVSKSGTEMNTTITEDGMTVYKNNEAMLTANNQGVRAANLHAITYLIIGRHSRIEDYDRDGDYRTGCFWIGDVF
jgi:archaellum component FlaC